MRALTRPRAESIEAYRHRIERLDPVQYLASSYYERHLAAMENAIVEAGTLTREEIENQDPAVR
jgi:nitrile hydratase subunit beta